MYAGPGSIRRRCATIVMASLVFAALLSAAMRDRATAEPTPWRFPVAPSSLTPVVVYEGHPTQSLKADVKGGRVSWIVEQNGLQVARLVASGARDDRLDVVLTAKAAGRFQYNLWINLGQARPLDVKGTRPDVGIAVFHYPYNWEKAHEIRARREHDGQDVANVAPIELIVPGFEAGGRFYAVDTWKLAKLLFRNSDNGSTVGIGKTVEVNQGYDTVSPDLALASGVSTTLSLLSAPTLEKLSQLRFGMARPVNGRLTFLYNKGWACAEPRCGIVPADYEMFAARLDGAFDMAIVRSYDPMPAIAQAFKRHSIDPYYYMFLGAERRTDGGHFGHDDWVLHDANGHQYGAPIVSPTSAWGLIDIRRPEVRAALVARATSALAMGYRGVFFDGPAFWLASDGHVGGSAPGATISWTFARDLLIQETRAALTAIDAKSRVGILGDRFYDAQALADFSLKESYGENWISIDPNPAARSLRNAATLNKAWDKAYRPFTTNNLFIGQKGSNPLFVAAGWQWGAETRRLFTEVGDAYQLDDGFHIPLDRMSRVLRDVSIYATMPNAVRITSLDPPDAMIITAGPSVIASKTSVKLKLGTATPILAVSAKSVTIADQVDVDPHTPIIIAERRNNDWSWSGYGFAFHDPDLYIYGDVLINEPPTGSTRDRIVLDVTTTPGPLSKKALPVSPNPFAPQSVVFHAPLPRHLVVKASDGRQVDAPLHASAAGTFSFTLPAEPKFRNFNVILDYAP